MKDIIQQGEKEFNEMRHGTGQFIVSSNVVYNWHTSQQHKLLQSIVEWIDKRCETNKRIRGTDKWNSDLEDIKAKLLEGNNK